MTYTGPIIGNPSASIGASVVWGPKNGMIISHVQEGADGAVIPDLLLAGALVAVTLSAGGSLLHFQFAGADLYFNLSTLDTSTMTIYLPALLDAIDSIGGSPHDVSAFDGIPDNYTRLGRWNVPDLGGLPPAMQRFQIFDGTLNPNGYDGLWFSQSEWDRIVDCDPDPAAEYFDGTTGLPGMPFGIYHAAVQSIQEGLAICGSASTTQMVLRGRGGAHACGRLKYVAPCPDISLGGGGLSTDNSGGDATQIDTAYRVDADGSGRIFFDEPPMDRNVPDAAGAIMNQGGEVFIYDSQVPDGTGLLCVPG
jgi:hypothetical protein